MKFDRSERYPEFAWTALKLAAAQSRGQRRHQAEAARVPLFADQLPPPAVFDAEAERAARIAAAKRADQRMRDMDARHWRTARTMYQCATTEQQAAIRAEWDAWTGPRRPQYFKYVVDVHTGVQALRSAEFKAEDRAMKQRIWSAVTAQQAFDMGVM